MSHHVEGDIKIGAVLRTPFAGPQAIPRVHIKAEDEVKVRRSLRSLFLCVTNEKITLRVEHSFCRFIIDFRGNLVIFSRFGASRTGVESNIDAIIKYYP